MESVHIQPDMFDPESDYQTIRTSRTKSDISPETPSNCCLTVVSLLAYVKGEGRVWFASYSYFMSDSVSLSLNPNGLF